MFADIKAPLEFTEKTVVPLYAKINFVPDTLIVQPPEESEPADVAEAAEVAEVEKVAALADPEIFIA